MAYGLSLHYFNPLGHSKSLWPSLLQVDPEREFMGAVSQLLSKHEVSVCRGRVDIHQDHGIVEH